jgi:hypothetical protein
MNDAEIVECIEKMESSTKALKHEMLSLCWYMRGSISYDEAMLLSLDERNIIGDIVKSNMEATKKSGLPFF